MPKSKSKPKTSDKPRKKTGMCLRQIDATTQLVCDDEFFPPVHKTEEEKLEKGYVRVDATTVVKAPSLGQKKSTIAPGAPKA